MAQNTKPRSLASSLIAASIISVMAASCTKKDEAGKPSGVAPSGAAAEPAGPGPALPGAQQPGTAEAPPPSPPPLDPPSNPGASISGEIVVAPAQRANIKPNDTIFLVARRISDNPTARGSLIAVKKLSAAAFPIPFSLSAADMPFNNGAFDGELTLTVRADKDGDPMTHKKGDVFGALPKVSVGARGVRLVLDQAQKEDESLGQPTGIPPSSGGAPLRGHPPMQREGAGGLPPGHP